MHLSSAECLCLQLDPAVLDAVWSRRPHRLTREEEVALVSSCPCVLLASPGPEPGAGEPANDGPCPVLARAGPECGANTLEEGCPARFEMSTRCCITAARRTTAPPQNFRDLNGGRAGGRQEATPLGGRRNCAVRGSSDRGGGVHRRNASPLAARPRAAECQGHVEGCQSEHSSAVQCLSLIRPLSLGACRRPDGTGSGSGGANACHCCGLSHGRRSL